MHLISIKNNLLGVFIVALILLTPVRAYVFDLDLQGQLSGWVNSVEIDNEWEKSIGLLYIPQVDLEHRLNKASSLDAEFSIKFLAPAGSGPFEDDIDSDLYRANIRYNTSQIETRAGLQKINFGQAVLLRPLRWFDSVEPTDPLQLTDGVYAMRFRYDALNSANLWVWALYGNDDTKGYELLPTEPDTIETGGRLQYPMLHGDLAFTAHTRKVDGFLYNIADFRENRFGVDGRWDVLVGLWFETSFAHQNTDFIINDWTSRCTIGMDYTFDAGNGLYTLVEHMTMAVSRKVFDWEDSYNISACSMNYPIGVMDTVKAIIYYDWDQRNYYPYLDWTRTYDNWMINLGFFYHPEGGSGSSGFNQAGSRRGSGGQLLITFNH